MATDLIQQIATFGLQVIESIYLQPARGFEQFLFDPDYLALPRSEIYPGVVKVGSEIYDGFLNNTYEAAFVQAGLGSGKSVMAALLMCAIAHWLLCKYDPHKEFGLLPDKPIAVCCMGPRQGQVKDVVFASIRSFITGGPFFQRLTDVTMEIDGQTVADVLMLWITFKRRYGGKEREIVKLLAGNSLETFPLGMNVFASVIDEISKFREGVDKSQFREVFETLDQRRLSRFGDKGVTICIGTAGAENSYIQRRAKQAEANPREYTHRGISWEWKGRNHRDYQGKGFFHFAKMDRGEGRGLHYKTYDGWPPPLDENAQVVLHLEDVPNTLRHMAERDPVKFLREFASVPSLALNPFDVNAQMLRRLINLDREHPLYPETMEPKDWFTGDPSINYYVHVDLGLNREGKGDCAGLCLAHSIGEKRVQVGEMDDKGDWSARFEFRPIIFIDLLLQIGAGPTGEVSFSGVREFLYRLQDWGFNISGQPLAWDTWGKVKDFRAGVSYDGWQSVDSVQLLQEKGICARVFSVDKDTSAYEMLRDTIQDSRLDVYKYEVEIEGLPVDIFAYEYEQLELVTTGSRRRVDHPEYGSKDVADSVAGVVSRITQDAARPMGGWV